MSSSGKPKTRKSITTEQGRSKTGATSVASDRSGAKVKRANERKMMEMAYERNQKRIEELEIYVGHLSEELRSEPKAKSVTSNKHRAHASSSSNGSSERAEWFGDAF